MALGQMRGQMRPENVVTLSGKPIRFAEAQELVVETLEKFLQQAKDGQLTAVGIAGLHLDGTVSWDMAGFLSSPALLGALHAVTAEVSETITRSRVEYE